LAGGGCLGAKHGTLAAGAAVEVKGVVIGIGSELVAGAGRGAECGRDVPHAAGVGVASGLDGVAVHAWSDAGRGRRGAGQVRRGTDRVQPDTQTIRLASLLIRKVVAALLARCAETNPLALWLRFADGRVGEGAASLCASLSRWVPQAVLVHLAVKQGGVLNRAQCVARRAVAPRAHIIPLAVSLDGQERASRVALVARRAPDAATVHIRIASHLIVVLARASDGAGLGDVVPLAEAVGGTGRGIIGGAVGQAGVGQRVPLAGRIRRAASRGREAVLAAETALRVRDETRRSARRRRVVIVAAVVGVALRRGEVGTARRSVSRQDITLVGVWDIPLAQIVGITIQCCRGIVAVGRAVEGVVTPRAGLIGLAANLGEVLVGALAVALSRAGYAHVVAQAVRGRLNVVTCLDTHGVDLIPHAVAICKAGDAVVVLKGALREALLLRRVELAIRVGEAAGLTGSVELANLTALEGGWVPRAAIVGVLGAGGGTRSLLAARVAGVCEQVALTVPLAVRALLALHVTRALHTSLVAKTTIPSAVVIGQASSAAENAATLAARALQTAVVLAHIRVG